MVIETAMIVDGVLAILLLSVIIVCMMVYRRLATIKEGQAELGKLVDDLNVAVLEAQRSVTDLKVSSTQISDTLGNDIARARGIADELSVITEAGNNLADRIEKGLTEGRGTAKAEKKAQPAEKSEQQKALLDALKQAR